MPRITPNETDPKPDGLLSVPLGGGATARYSMSTASGNTVQITDSNGARATLDANQRRRLAALLRKIDEMENGGSKIDPYKYISPQYVSTGHGNATV